MLMIHCRWKNQLNSGQVFSLKTAHVPQMEDGLMSVPLGRRANKDPKLAGVTITEVFDFAGEKVWVSKKVSADSREAKSCPRNWTNKTKERG